MLRCVEQQSEDRGRQLRAPDGPRFGERLVARGRKLGDGGSDALAPAVQEVGSGPRAGGSAFCQENRTLCLAQPFSTGVGKQPVGASR
jgi:hypothetical protein